FPGQWFPRANDVNNRPLFCTTMLALLKPWRSVLDLKQEDASFKESYNEFYDQTSPKMHKIIENIQYFYE
ncbi:hypothetical protein J3R82DRAFT_11852, partial [Butyriboletus roseoflavus]